MIAHITKREEASYQKYTLKENATIGTYTLINSTSDALINSTSVVHFTAMQRNFLTWKYTTSISYWRPSILIYVASLMHE